MLRAAVSESESFEKLRGAMVYPAFDVVQLKTFLPKGRKEAKER